MNQKIKQSVEDLKHIREMMEQSNKFLSLSGLSGIVAGLVALIGALMGYKIIHYFEIHALGYSLKGIGAEKIEQLEIQLLLLSVAVLLLALGLGFFFTYLKAKKKGVSLYSPASFKVAKALFLPLVFGGLFTLILGKYELYQLAGAATLTFYGMSLLNASKFLNIEIKYLAISEMVLGILAGLFLNQVLIFWALGFGVLHILYGSIMYFKYDRKG
jgi:predicted lysophospholipase L1 biosynthesis ABC-type transport system permease subunit